MISVKEHRTNILPLRWFANYISSPIAYYFFVKGLRIYHKYEDDYDKEINFVPPKFDKYRIKVYFKLYSIINVPYMKWGTFYRIDFNDV